MQGRRPGETGRIGPILYLRGHAAGRLELAVLVVTRDESRPALTTDLGSVAPERIGGRLGWHVLRYGFSVPACADAWYAIDGDRFEVNAAVDGDLRVVFVSCNGQEHGDQERPEAERNLMWRRLCAEHRDLPFNLMLQGGDQLYADEVTEAHPATGHWPRAFPRDIGEDEQQSLAETLADGFFRRYVEQLSQPEFAWFSARVPSLAMWDDHDICDGWGSLAVRKLDSAVGRTVFAAARDHFLMFQLAAAPEEVPGICLDRSGRSLTWSVALPGVTLLAPDLRSERRPHLVMGECGWQAFRRAMAAAEPGKVLLVSTVPALGPRLSLLERAMRFTPWMEKYEDDLRDQWQSRTHRTEWQAFLRSLINGHERANCSVTVVSGEIHLATRGTMATAAGDLHQLVASGSPIRRLPPPTPGPSASWRASARRRSPRTRSGCAPCPADGRSTPPSATIWCWSGPAACGPRPGSWKRRE